MSLSKVVIAQVVFPEELYCTVQYSTVYTVQSLYNHSTVRYKIITVTERTRLGFYIYIYKNRTEPHDQIFHE